MDAGSWQWVTHSTPAERSPLYWWCISLRQSNHPPILQDSSLRDSSPKRDGDRLVRYKDLSFPRDTDKLRAN